MSAAAVILLALVAGSGLLAIAAATRTAGRTARRTTDGGDDAGSDGGGGSQPRVPPARPPGPSGLEASPAWWPAFEREFAAYVRRREHAGSGAH